MQEIYWRNAWGGKWGGRRGKQGGPSGHDASLTPMKGEGEGREV